MTDSIARVSSFQQIQFDFTGKRVLVTGASRGIGLAVAAGFCKAGASVSILADDAAVFDVASDLSTLCAMPVVGHCCDISQSDQVEQALSNCEPVDILINNAGIEKATPVVDRDAADKSASDELFRRVIDVNVMGTYYVSRAVAATMPASSTIVFTCSIWSRTAVANYSAYCSSKHAVLGMMRSLAHELGPRGIRVNGVCPGWVRTQASMQSLADMAATNNTSTSQMLDDIVSAQVLDGLMMPEDLVSMYLFLASDAASNITGQAFTVDRGEVMA